MADRFVDAIEDAPDDVISIGGKIVDPTGTLIDFIGGMLTFDGHAFQNGFRYPLGVARRSASRIDELLFACGGNMISRRAPLHGARRVRRRLLRLPRGRRLRLAYVDRRLSRAVRAARASSATRRARPATASAISSAACSSSATRCRRRIKNLREPCRGGGSVLFTYLHAAASLRDDPQRRRGRADARAVLEALDIVATFGRPNPAQAARPQAAGDDRRSADGDAVPRVRLDRGARATARHETRTRCRSCGARSDREIFERFPLQIVPTYPGDEALMRSALFRLLRPRCRSIERRAGRYHASREAGCAAVSRPRCVLAAAPPLGRAQHAAVGRADVLSSLVGVFLLWGPGRRGVMRNLKAIMPGSTADRELPPLLSCLLELRLDDRRQRSLQGAARRSGLGVRRPDHFEALQAQQGGAIILTAHMGSYDLGAHLFAETSTRPHRDGARAGDRSGDAAATRRSCTAHVPDALKSTSARARASSRSIFCTRCSAARSSPFRAIA